MKTEALADQAIVHCNIVASLAKAGLITWSEVPVPKPGAMNAFKGVGSNYTIMLARANTLEEGIVILGMITTPNSILIKLPDGFAAELYQQTNNQRN